MDNHPDRDAHKALGHRFMEIRESMGLRRCDLFDHKKMESHYMQLTQWELGRRKVPLFTIAVYCRKIKIKPHELFRDVLG